MTVFREKHFFYCVAADSPVMKCSFCGYESTVAGHLFDRTHCEKRAEYRKERGLSTVNFPRSVSGGTIACQT